MNATVRLTQIPMIGKENQGYLVVGLVNLTTHDIGDQLTKNEVTLLCRDRRIDVEIGEWVR